MPRTVSTPSGHDAQWRCRTAQGGNERAEEGQSAVLDIVPLTSGSPADSAQAPLWSSLDKHRGFLR